METIRYITNSKGKTSGLLIDLDSARKMMKKNNNIVALLEDIEDIVAIELSKDEKSIPYSEARKKIFSKK